MPQAAIEERVARLEARVEGFDERFGGLEQRTDRFEGRMRPLTERMDRPDAKADRFRDELSGRIGALDQSLSQRIKPLDHRVSGRLKSVHHQTFRDFIWTVGQQVAVLLAVVTALAGR